MHKFTTTNCNFDEINYFKYALSSNVNAYSFSANSGHRLFDIPYLH